MLLFFKIETSFDIYIHGKERGEEKVSFLKYITMKKYLFSHEIKLF